MGLRFDPIGGGQFKQAVQQLIEIEKQPLKALEARKAREESRMKLFQDFKGRFAGVDKALSEFRDFRKFRELKVDLGDGQTLMGVTVDKEKAEPGTYTIQIDELAQRSSIVSNNFEDPEEKALGIGFIVMELSNGDTKEVFIDGDNASLRGVASAINRESDCPVRASVIRDDTDPEAPWRLIMTSKKEGVGESVTFPDFYFLDGTADFYTEDDHEAANASLLIDGFPIETSGNQVADFLQGVSVQLKAARKDQPFTLSITEDHQKISGKVKGLVDELNKILEFINKQNQVDEKSDTKASFAGDTSLQNMEYRIRNLVHQGYLVGDSETGETRTVYMGELGIEFEKNGLISFKEERFTKMLERDFEGLAQMMTGPYGFASTLKETIDGYTKSLGGALSIREQGLRNRIQQIDDQIESKSRNIERRSQSITDRFSRLQSTLSNLQRQQQYLSATLGSGGGNNLVSQLLGG